MLGGDWSGHLYEEQFFRFWIQQKDTVSIADWNCSRSEPRVQASRPGKRKDILTQEFCLALLIILTVERWAFQQHNNNTLGIRLFDSVPSATTWLVNLMFIGACIIVIAEEWKTNLMSLAILFHFLCAQHVSDINISIIRSLRLCCWITTSVIFSQFVVCWRFGVAGFE